MHSYVRFRLEFTWYCWTFQSEKPWTSAALDLIQPTGFLVDVAAARLHVMDPFPFYTQQRMLTDFAIDLVLLCSKYNAIVENKLKIRKY